MGRGFNKRRSKPTALSLHHQLKRNRKRFLRILKASESKPRVPRNLVIKSREIRNPFLQFMAHYRQQVKDCKIPSVQLAMKAGRIWNRMSAEEKGPFQQAAQKSAYVFRSRNCRLNRFVTHLRSAFPDEKTINGNEVFALLKELREWKSEVLDSVLKNSKDFYSSQENLSRNRDD